MLLGKWDVIYSWWWFKQYLRFSHRHRVLALLLYPLVTLVYFIIAGLLGVLDILYIMCFKRNSKK